MAPVPCFHHDGDTLYNAAGNRFDPATLSFGGKPEKPDPSWIIVTGREAVKWLQARPERIRPPIGVIGPREATDREREQAYRLGRELGAVGLTVLCGGRQGVMEAVCKGVSEENGVSIGLLPERDWKTANPHVGVPLSTGIGIARNALIACSAHVIVAVGSGLGTISEMALGLQFGKKVFALADGCAVPGVRAFPTWEELEPHFYAAVLDPHEQ